MKAAAASMVLAMALAVGIGQAATAPSHCRSAVHGKTKPCVKRPEKHLVKHGAAPQLRMQPAKEDSASQPPDATDTSNAISLRQAGKLPSTREQFDTLKGQIVRARPAMLDARQKSDALKAEAQSLERKLIATAAHVVALEGEQQRLDGEIARLEADDNRFTAEFLRHRQAVARLLAILERMQHDMPPAIVLRPNDALSAVRGAMLVGASVPSVYAQAKALAGRIRVLKRTRAALVLRRAESVRNAAALKVSRAELDRLLAAKQLEADAAAERYGDLAERLAKAAEQAADLKSLLEKVSTLRQTPAQQDVLVVSAKPGTASASKPGPFLAPVAGHWSAGGVDGVGGSRAPGITFSTEPGARVIAPADSRVIFAGPYHKTGLVLILEVSAAYDVVLAGLGRVDVRPSDAVLAGEPVGTMPDSAQHELLYFELRQEGHGKSPAPWLAVELRKAQK